MKPLCAWLCLAIALLAQTVRFPITPVAGGPVAGPSNLSAAFLEWPGIDGVSTPAYLEELHGLGIDTLVTVGTRNKPDCNLPGYKWAATPQQIGQVLAEAQQRGMKVYLGLVSNACEDWAGDAAEADRLVEELVRTFGGYPSLAGWYIANEPYIQDDRWLDGQIQYFAAQVAAIRKHSGLPVTVSPYLVSQWPGSPAAAADCALRFLAGTGIDVLIYQDGMGTRSNENIGWQTFPSPQDYFSSISLRIGRDRLWVLHELFNQTFGVDGGTGSITITQLNQQIAMVPDSVAAKQLTWTNQEWMSAVVPNRFLDAERLLAGYRATHGGPGRLLQPASLTWIALGPAPSSGILWDGIAGDPFRPDGLDWLRVPRSPTGAAGLLVDLGQNYSVDWISLQAAKQQATGILPPSQMIVWGLVDYDWQQLLSRSFSSVAGFDGQQALGNSKPFGANCRFLYIYLVAPGETRLGELEIIAKN